MLACSVTGDMVPLLLGWGERHSNANVIVKDLFQFMYVMQIQHMKNCQHGAGEQCVRAICCTGHLSTRALLCSSCSVLHYRNKPALKRSVGDSWKGNVKRSCLG